MPYAAKADQVIQYTGSNSAAIIAALNAQAVLDANIVTETGGILTVYIASYGGPSNGGGETTVPIHQNDWAHITYDWLDAITAAEFTTQWIVKA